MTPAQRVAACEATKRYFARNPEKRCAWRKAYAARSPLRTAFNRKRCNAGRADVKFALTFEDMVWPEYCPVLGLKLDFSYGTKGTVQPNSLSFDRLDISKGYTHDNVIVVSHLANSLRQNHSVEQLRELAPRSPQYSKVYKFYSTLFSSLQKQPECI